MLLKYFLAALALCITLSHADAQTFKGSAIDESFTLMPHSRVRDNANHFSSILYIKLVPYKGRVAVCGGYTGRSFERNNRGFLHKAIIGTDKPLLTNISFLQRLQKFRRAPSNGENYIGHHPEYTASYVHGKGLPSKCKVSKVKWTPQHAKQKIGIAWPVRRYIGMRKI